MAKAQATISALGELLARPSKGQQVDYAGDKLTVDVSPKEMETPEGQARFAEKYGRKPVHLMDQNERTITFAKRPEHADLLADPRPLVDVGGVKVPGGLEGTFNLADMFYLKNSGINPRDLPEDVHAAIHKKMLRSVQKENPTSAVEQLDRLGFGITSGNAPLTKNEFEWAQMRPRNEDEMSRLGASYSGTSGDRLPSSLEYNKLLAESVGVQGAPAGGTGVRNTADYSNVATLAQDMGVNPQFFQRAAGEDWAKYVERINNQARGLGAKTGSLGIAFTDPANSPVSAIDRHIADLMIPEIKSDPAGRVKLEQSVVTEYNRDLPKSKKLKTAKGIAAKVTPEEYAKLESDALRGFVSSPKNVKYRDSSGNVRDQVQSHQKSTSNYPFYEPDTIQEMPDAYKIGLEKMSSEGAPRGLEGFGNQWFAWDRQRQRLEPHEIFATGAVDLPRLTPEEYAYARQQHSNAGFFRTTKDEGGRLSPTKPRESWKNLQYWGPTGAAALLGGLGAGGSEEAEASVVPAVLKAATDVVDEYGRIGSGASFSGAEGQTFIKPHQEATARVYDQLRNQQKTYGEPVFDSTPEAGTGKSGSGIEGSTRHTMPAEYSKKLEEIGVSTPDLIELPQGEESAKKFTRQITDAKNKNKFGAAVYVYPEADYTGMRLFTTEDGTAGYALKPDGDIVSAYSTGAHKGVAPHLLLSGIENGGKKLDAFDTVLPDIYAQMGFREGGRVRWDDGEAPPDWDKELFGAFNNGEPDVSLMGYSESPAVPVKENMMGDYGDAMSAQERILSGGTGALAAGAVLGGSMIAPEDAEAAFAGTAARNADKFMLSVAQKMKGEGVPRDEIWQKTGWGQGVDGKWRFEIDDSGASVREMPDLFAIEDHLGNPVKKRYEGTLSGYLDHPELDNAYTIGGQTVIKETPGDGGSLMNYGSNDFSGGKNSYGMKVGNEGDRRSTTLHETQHAIQAEEGFARGGSTAGMLDDVENVGSLDPNMARAIAYDRYQRLAGEVEARNVQGRMNMSPQERRDMPPWWTEDFPESEQIILGSADSDGSVSALNNELRALNDAGVKFSRMRAEKDSYWGGLRKKLSDLMTAGDDFVRPIMPYVTSALAATEKPMQGYYGIASALGELAGGSGLDEALQRGADVARQPIADTADEYGGALADRGYPIAGTALNTAMQITGPI